MLDVVQSQTGFGQDIFDRVPRKAGVVFIPGKTFFLGRGDDFAINQCASGGIAVVGVQPNHYVGHGLLSRTK